MKEFHTPPPDDPSEAEAWMEKEAAFSFLRHPSMGKLPEEERQRIREILERKFPGILKEVEQSG
jgi:hypothetical protein